MIKKPTLIVLLCAIILGGAVYYQSVRPAKEAKSTSDSSKPALPLKASDVSGIILSHPAKASEAAVQVEKKGDTWEIDQPIQTGADGSTVEGIVNAIAGAQVSQTEPGTADRLKAYGLDPAGVSLELGLRNGSKHTVTLGDKDITGSYVYGVIDGAKTVSLLPESILSASDKSLDDLRDRTALHIASGQVASFTLKSSSGEFEAAKQNNQWKFTKPVSAFADQDAISSLLSAVENARMASVASEKPEDLGKYGLANPAIVFTATNDIGKKSTLFVGSKSGDNYYARDAARPMIFSVNDSLHVELAKTFGDLRDRKVAHFDPADVNRVEIHNEHGIIAAVRKNDTDWAIDSPAAQKGKPAEQSKIVDSVAALQAQNVIDHPQANVSAQLDKPGIEVDLTDKNGKKITLKMSKPAGDLVYAEISDGPGVYQLKKDDYDSLNFDASQAIQPSGK